ncbi:MAG: pyrroline-5-carboxylate reductase [Betaproteobacteria bacterium]
MNLAFIGGGNMASALIGGLVNDGVDARGFRVVEPMAEQHDRLAARFPGIGIFADVTRGAIDGAELVVLAVKPQQMRDAAMALAPFVVDVPVVMSIAAGTRITDLTQWLGGYSRIVRAMPNTPALVGAGVSGIFAPPEVSAASRELARRVLEAAGAVVAVDAEAMLDAVTGISGSGPAYVFYFLEALEQAARELGFSAADARTLSYGTFAGAIKLAQASDLEPGILRAQVTSKGGTTERALATLESGHVKTLVIAAAKAAAERAREMGEGA